ncbi:hypothetical protein [Undibacterium baiyunense]|nr:hypothetical protein [Undibacterium baiyunense]
MEPLRKVPWFIGEIFGWVGAGLLVCIVSALGVGEHGIAIIAGAVIGVLLFLKLASDTKNDPAKGLLYCRACKSYSSADKPENLES